MRGRTIGMMLLISVLALIRLQLTFTLLTRYSLINVVFQMAMVRTLLQWCTFGIALVWPQLSSFVGVNANGSSVKSALTPSDMVARAFGTLLILFALMPSEQ
jgi:hypothetical protein